jgi:hypothetical protein
MSETKIKVETVCDDYDQIESVDCIENNIKKEPEVQFVLILPPRQVKVEIFEGKNEEKYKTQNEKNFQCQQCPKSFSRRRNLYEHEQTHDSKDFL